MTTSAPAEPVSRPPNHHAAFPAFAGVGGLVAALSFTIGRGPDAELAIRLTDLGPDDEVIDIGCGPGVAVRRAASTGAASVVGIDPASVMLRVARALSWPSRRHAPAVRYLHGAAEALPIPNDSVTVVWSLATVHHWRDLETGLGEARRVLRPSGRLLAIERRVEPDAAGHASHGWTEDQAQRFAEQCRTAGFAHVEIGHHQASRTRAHCPRHGALSNCPIASPSSEVGEAVAECADPEQWCAVVLPRSLRLHVHSTS